MPRSIRQRRALLVIEAEILPGGIAYRQRGVFSSHDATIAFENVSDDTIRVFHVNRLYLAICAFFAVLLALTAYRTFVTHEASLGRFAVSVLWFLAPTFGTWMNSAPHVGLVAHPTSLMFFDTRGDSDPSAFLDAVRAAKAEYLQRHDGVTDDTPTTRAHGFLVDAAAERARRGDTTSRGG